MRHYVLTRSSYGPDLSGPATFTSGEGELFLPALSHLEPDASRGARRLEKTRAITAPSMASQTCRDWTWVVLLDSRDPLLAERMAIYEAAAPRFRPLIWTPDGATGASWREGIGPANDLILQTRLDDDDALAPDAIARLQRAATGLTERTILMQPIGYRLCGRQVSRYRHDCNMMQTLVTPPGDDLVVYDYPHRECAAVAPVRTVDEHPAWLWVRHGDTISDGCRAGRPVSSSVRRLFRIDWQAAR